MYIFNWPLCQLYHIGVSIYLYQYWYRQDDTDADRYTYKPGKGTSLGIGHCLSAFKDSSAGCEVSLWRPAFLLLIIPSFHVVDCVPQI